MSEQTNYGGTNYQINTGEHNTNIFQPLPPPSPTGIPSNLPRKSSTFVGRSRELRQLHRTLLQASSVAITALRGMGGVGKTELALQYAHRQLQRRPAKQRVNSVCWVEALSQDIGVQVIQYFQAQLGRSLPDQLADDLAVKVQYCWRHWPKGDVLVVFNDVASYGLVKPYLPPQEPRFQVILTSRNQLGASVNQLELGVLSELASLELVRSLVTDARMSDPAQDVAKQLCRDLGYLPLALELVGNYLRLKPDVTLQQVQERITSKKLAARALRRPADGTAADLTTTHESVLAAFELSWAELSPAAQELGLRLSLFAAAPIPWNLVTALLPETDPEDLEDLQTNLCNLSLLSRVEQNSYQLHPLIREFFALKREQSETDRALKQAHCHTLVQVAREIPWEGTQQTYQAVAPVVPHLEEAIVHLSNDLKDEDILPFARGLTGFYHGQGLYAQESHLQSGV